MEACSEAAAPLPKAVDENVDEWVPDDAEKEESVLAEQRRVKQVQEAAARDTAALRNDASKRMGMLDSLLDKTAMYSQFVSSNIKVVDKVKKKPTEDDDEEESEEEEEEGDEGATRSGRKRAAGASAKPKKKRTKAAAKDKFNLDELTGEDAEKQREAGTPDLISAKMRDYQMQGVAWLVSLWENGMNGILGDEMGLGKTLQTIGMMAHLKEKSVPGPFLVVAPLSTLNNWHREVTKWTGGVADNDPKKFREGKMNSQVYHGPQTERDALRLNWHKVDVVITSFEVVMRDIRHFQLPRFKGRSDNNQWKYLTIDEGHRLKNKDCRLIRELKTINSANRLLLTGTPLQNDLTELWALLNFLLPNIFDDLRSFQSWFDFSSDDMQDDKKIIGMETQNKLVSKLHTILRPFLLRRQKKDVDLDIPPKKELILYCRNTDVQNEVYQNILLHRQVTAPPESDSEEEDLAPRARNNICYDEDAVSDRDWLRAVDNDQDLDALTSAKVAKKHGSGKTSIAQLSKKEAVKKAVKPSSVSLNNMLMQLRKVCNHPYLFEELDTLGQHGATDETIVQSCGKMQLLDRLMPRLVDEGHKILIFSQMTQILAILEDYLLLRRWDYRRLDGGVGRLEREQFMDDFNDPAKGVNVFLLSTRAGGLGINLIAADTVIIYDSDWNPQADLQAQDRCHRIGQTKPVLVYRLCQAGTVEEKMLERAANKRKLEHMVVSNGKFVQAGATTKASSIKALSQADLMELLQDNYADGKVTTDTDKGQISEADLVRIMDRSTMVHGRKGKKAAAAAALEETTAFKVISQDDGGGLVDMF